MAIIGSTAITAEANTATTIIITTIAFVRTWGSKRAVKRTAIQQIGVSPGGFNAAGLDSLSNAGDTRGGRLREDSGQVTNDFFRAEVIFSGVGVGDDVARGIHHDEARNALAGVFL